MTLKVFLPRLDFCRALTLGVLVAAIPYRPAHAAKEAPEARTAAVIDVLKQVKNGDTLSPEDQEHNQALSTQLEQYIDYDRIAKAAIGPHQRLLSATQLQQFNHDFRQLIRDAALFKSSSMLQKASLQVQKPKVVGGHTIVETRAQIPEQDVDTRISFQWDDLGPAWRVTDVILDGASVVKDYQNQFGRLIKKDGVEGFLGKLKARATTPASGAGAQP